MFLLFFNFSVFHLSSLSISSSTTGEGFIFFTENKHSLPLLCPADKASAATVRILPLVSIAH